MSFEDIRAFRRHVVQEHDKSCSWSDDTRPFIDATERDRFLEAVSKAVVEKCRNKLGMATGHSMTGNFNSENLDDNARCITVRTGVIRCGPVPTGAPKFLPVRSSLTADAATSNSCSALYELNGPKEVHDDIVQFLCFPLKFKYIDYSSLEMADSSTRKRPKDSEGRRMYRRNREKGPWTCADCDVHAMGDITTFRRHVVLKHDNHCSWSGHIRPFHNASERQRTLDVISKSGKHRKISTAKVNSDPVVQSEAILPSLCPEMELTVDDNISEAAIQDILLATSTTDAAAQT